jgi:hypothetical protein
MTKKLREEFDKFILEVCPLEYIQGLMIICHKSDERMRDMMDYIKSNNLDCKCLWEDSEQGDKAYTDYEKIQNRALSYEGVILDENNNVVESEEDDN